MKNQFGQNTNKNISDLEVYYFKVNTKRESIFFLQEVRLSFVLTLKYIVNLEVEIQRLFFGRSYTSTILFRDQLTFSMTMGIDKQSLWKLWAFKLFWKFWFSRSFFYVKSCRHLSNWHYFTLNLNDWIKCKKVATNWNRIQIWK